MKRKAFTLIELIIVIVVLGILATIAIVGYRAVIDRANLSSAENAAKSFDRQIRAQAAFGMDGNPNMTDPRRGQLMIDMLQDPAAGGSAIKDLPDADVAAASLSTNSLRVLVWNGNWVRLCTTNAGCVPTGSTGANSAGAIVLPVGSTASTPSASELCLLFRKGGQTVYLGLSDSTNTPGTVSSTLVTACPMALSVAPPTTLIPGTNATYRNIGSATVVFDTTW